MDLKQASQKTPYVNRLPDSVFLPKTCSFLPHPSQIFKTGIVSILYIVKLPKSITKNGPGNACYDLLSPTTNR